MSDLPRLELREDQDSNKKNDYIIFRYPSKGKQTEIRTRKNVYKKRSTHKKKHSSVKRRKSHKKKHSQSKKGFFNFIL